MKGSSGLLLSEQISLPELIDHMRQGQTILGSHVKPYPWLDYALKPKSEMEMKIESGMTSCSFKTVTSCVIGK